MNLDNAPSLRDKQLEIARMNVERLENIIEERSKEIQEASDHLTYLGKTLQGHKNMLKEARILLKEQELLTDLRDERVYLYTVNPFGEAVHVDVKKLSV